MRLKRESLKICVCSPHFASQAYYQRLRGIYKYIGSLVIPVDMQIRIINSQNQLESFIDSLSEKSFNGVIFISLSLTDDQVMKVKGTGTECVLIENDSSCCTCITYDNFEGGTLAARYFLEHNYRNFGIVCEPFHWEHSVYTTQDRLMGFQAEIGAAGLKIQKEHVYESKIDSVQVREKFDKIFPTGNYPRAMFVPADMMAIGLIQAAHDCGLRVPEDVAVIGFDDVDFAGLIELTTVSQHLDKSGELAAKALLDKIRNPNHEENKIELKLTLIERKSA